MSYFNSLGNFYWKNFPIRNRVTLKPSNGDIPRYNLKPPQTHNKKNYFNYMNNLSGGTVE